MSQSSSDRNLLFGILALQMEFVTRDQLVAAMHAWMLDKSQSLGEVFVRQQVLTEHRRRLLNELVQEHIAQHENDLEQSLTAVCTRNQLGPEFQANHVREVWANMDATLSVLNQKSPSAPDASTLPPEPSRVAGGRFRVLRLHDKGGLGQVMLATDAELGRTVALKEIQPFQADDPVSRQRFMLEAEVTGGLEHPCVVPVYGCGTYPDGRPYYAMRFIRGDDLGKSIRRFHDPAVERKPGARIVELQQLLRRFLDVCNAVQYAHSRGVLHRDIKPANVMLGKYGETLLVDWGLAKLIGRPEASREAGEVTLHLPSSGGSYATLYGSAMGTPAYMSPEQAAGDLDQLGPASDVYSLGATLYCLLTGQAPFTKKQGNILKLVQAGEFPRPREIQRDIAPALEAICLKAMALVPEKRYVSPAALIKDIEHWLADEPTSAYTETRSERAARWMRRHRARVQAAAMSLTVTTVILLLATFLVTRAWQSEKTAHALATHSKQQAVTRFVQARDAVDKWLTGGGHTLVYYPGVQKSRDRLLELAAQDSWRIAG
ncbi:MAG: serine/threonine-protein kinase [Planctomycetota bacterium]|nr:serine/threonine-protein kinase [Planctomycetota bacterium]